MSNKNLTINWGCLLAPTMVIVGLIFLTLKLIGIGLPSEWSWWVVLLPWYGLPLTLFILWTAFMLLSFIFGILSTVVGNYSRKLRRKRVAEEDERRRNRSTAVGRCNICGESYVGLAQDCGCTKEA